MIRRKLWPAVLLASVLSLSAAAADNRQSRVRRAGALLQGRVVPAMVVFGADGRIARRMEGEALDGRTLEALPSMPRLGHVAR